MADSTVLVLFFGALLVIASVTITIRERKAIRRARLSNQSLLRHCMRTDAQRPMELESHRAAKPVVPTTVIGGTLERTRSVREQQHG